MNAIEAQLIESISQAIDALYHIETQPGMVMVEIPKDKTKGDYSTNIAMRLKKVLNMNPQEIANGLVGELSKSDIIASVEVAGPGFINFWMKKDVLANVIDTILEQGNDFGKNNAGKGEKVLVEYVSANPTGILHLGHARGAAWGDSLTRIMKASGFDVCREYYVNDAGAQIDNLGKSVFARYLESYGKPFTLPEDGYHGEDVKAIALKIRDEVGDKYVNCSEEEVLDFFKAEGKRLEMQRIEKDLDYFRVGFDSWISELSIYQQGRVEKVMETMAEKGLTYEKDDAIWFRSTDFGDDKDRVLKKSNGLYTYLTPDIANHVYKLERGYSKLVNLWGADHHGYIPRMKAALQALGYAPDCLEVDIIQMVRLVENGMEVKMSKRTGNALTIRELCEDIGVDATRYFFVSRALDTHLDFDLGLARSQTSDNPVYYAQYAHARICSIIAACNYEKATTYDLLVHDKEVQLLKYLNEFSNVVADCALTRSPNKMCTYIQRCASLFHTFYNECKVNDPSNPQLSSQRVALCQACEIVLKNALYYIGVSAPEKM